MEGRQLLRRERVALSQPRACGAEVTWADDWITGSASGVAGLRFRMGAVRCARAHGSAGCQWLVLGSCMMFAACYVHAVYGKRYELLMRTTQPSCCGCNRIVAAARAGVVPFAFPTRRHGAWGSTRTAVGTPGSAGPAAAVWW